MIEEGLEEANVRVNREAWFEEGECFELRQVERWSAGNCTNNEVNSAISAERTTLDKN